MSLKMKFKNGDLVFIIDSDYPKIYRIIDAAPRSVLLTPLDGGNLLTISPEWLMSADPKTIVKQRIKHGTKISH